MTAQPAPASITVAGPGLPKVAHGKGSYVWDTSGKQYIDGSCGPAVYCIGHGNEEVNAAITDQLGRIAHGYRYNFTSDALEELTAIVAAELRRHAQEHGVRDRRLGGGRILPQARAAISCGAGRDEPPPLHRARALLARQHARARSRCRASSSAAPPSRARSSRPRACRPPMSIARRPGRRPRRPAEVCAQQLEDEILRARR